MATFTVSSFLYFTQKLRGEALRASRGWLEFDFDPPVLAWKNALPNCTSKT
jgi:hypothetical protein